MSKNNDLRRGRHCIFMMHVHLVFVTKDRRVLFTKEIMYSLREIFTRVCIDFESQLVEFEGRGDYVHLLVHYPPKVSVSSLVNSLKGVSSRLLRRKRGSTPRHQLWSGPLWSPSYFAGSCGGPSSAVVRKYIEQQQVSATDS